MNPKKIAILVIGVVGLLVLIAISGSLLETNNMGYYQIKQAAISGTMSVRNKPGMYLQMFGSIIQYQVSDEVYFSKHKEDGGSGADAAAVKVRFNDGGTADISGSIKFRLSTKEDNQLRLHEEFKGYRSVKQDLVRQIITESLMQTATLMKAEESYSTRRSEFTSLSESQIKDGIYETVAKEFKKKDADGNEFIKRVVSVAIGKNGNVIVRKISPFKRYDIEILQFVIKDIDFDPTIDALIAKKKEAEQQKVVAKANAERAKQDAITAREQGAANIATAKALEEVEKIKAVTVAKKKFEVAQYEAKQALEEAKKTKAAGEAEAYAARLKVKAGLTPLEKAEIDMKTRIGVSANLAKVVLPKFMILGGSAGGGGTKLNPFDAVGLKQFIDIVDQTSTGK